MRETTRAAVRHYTEELNLSGHVLEIGGFRLRNSAIDLFPPPRFDYFDLNIEESDIPQTIIGDLTNCREVVADESVDVVFTSDVMEHVDRPWLAAAEVERILKPGGVAFVWTLWSWRNHPCPIDYWRFSPECLEFLFSPLTCLERGYDLSQRRWNATGFWESGLDSVPIDQLGGFLENWAVYGVFRKGDGPAATAFRDTQADLAAFLRMDTQGTVTNPTMLGREELPDPMDQAVRVERAVSALEQRIVRSAGQSAEEQRRLAFKLDKIAAAVDELRTDRAEQRERSERMTSELRASIETMAADIRANRRRSPLVRLRRPLGRLRRRLSRSASAVGRR